MANHPSAVIPRKQAFDRPDAVKRRRRAPTMSPLVLQACELLLSGNALTITEAAAQLNCTRDHLSRQLNRDHVKAYLQQSAKLETSLAVGFAAKVKLDLLRTGASEKVRNDIATELMAMSGIQAPKQGNNTNVSVSVSAGYIIDLTGVKADAPTIDATVAHDVDAT